MHGSTGSAGASDLLRFICYTGPSGSIGQFMPAGARPLITRLEAPVGEMVRELEGLDPRPQSLIHLAAMSIVEACEDDPATASALNVDGALKWFLAARHTGIGHFVQVSTSHVYGRPQGNGPLTASSPTQPVNVYGRTKLEAERRLLAESPPPKVTVARVFSVLSRAMRPGYLLTSLHARARNADFSSIPGYHEVRDFLWADQVCDRLTRIASWREAPPVVLICSGTGRRVCDVAREVFEEYGLDFSRVLTPTGESDATRVVGVPTPL